VIKSSNKKYLSDLADKLWHEACWLMWGDKCEICGRSASQMHHIVPRSASKNLAYDVLNGVPMCTEHHNNMHNSVGKLTPEELRDRIFKKRGEWQREYLENNKHVPCVNSVKWLRETIEYLKEIIIKLK